MKKWIALIAMLLAVLMLSGCNLIGYDAELDGAQAVAKVNGTELTKADWQSYTEYLASYYQQYYQQYFGFTMELTEDDYDYYGELALEQMIESTVVQDKIKELGFDQLGEEETAEVEEYADSMIDFYKMIWRMQYYADVETVEEEQERLAAEAEATPSEATEASVAVATITDAELDEMIMADMAAVGYTREYLIQSQTSSLQSEKIYDYVIADVDVTDDEVKAEFDSTVAEQKETFDATPTLYASYVNNGYDVYYVPEGYRGVKNLLVKITDEVQAQIDELESTLSTAKSSLSSANSDLEELKAADTSEYDEGALADYNAQVAALEEQAAAAQATIDETEPALTAATEAAYAEILPTAEEALAKAQAGEDFNALIETYGEDTGMQSEPAKTEGYRICEGLTLYVDEFQTAAMALENIGDISGLVKTDYGYHILQYTCDIAAGEVEYTEEIKTAIYEEMLSSAQSAAYEAAVTQWVSEASVETFPKVME